MKNCSACNQPLGEDMHLCPFCGGKVPEGRTRVDDYELLGVVRDGFGSTLYRARRGREGVPVLLRIFKPASGIDAAKVDRLKLEMEEINRLPPGRFVRILEIRQSSEGSWYRVSEWVDTLDWGDLIAAGTFTDLKTAFGIFAQIADSLAQLHRAGHFIPHLIRDDVLVSRADDGRLSVKIDYRLSRFVDPAQAVPGTNLKSLMDDHPDMGASAPLDLRSDTWSLGRLFGELLTGEQRAAAIRERLGAVPLPANLALLLRRMLEPDPDARPVSMEEISHAFAACTEREIAEAARARELAALRPAREISQLKRLFLATGAGLALLLGAGLFLQLRYGLFSRDDTKVLSAYAAKYKPSVAYVVTEYWLAENGKKIYRNVSEGTAFLVDSAGHLLTNRHVACPWLEDEKLARIAPTLGEMENPPVFDHRTYVWFDGSPALYRHGELSAEVDLAEVFRLDTAYRSDGAPGVRIAAVAPQPKSVKDIMESPLGDDVAVLQLDPPPEGRVPLPLARETTAAEIRDLAPVIAIGFPRGREQNPGERVSASVSMGHLRRHFSHQIQTDVSIHPGNSGGPIVGIDGRVIGIASAIATERGLLSAQGLSDFGLILPAADALALLDKVRDGKPVWKGDFDPALNRRLNEAFLAAREGRLPEARRLVEAERGKSRDADVETLAGILDLCEGNRQRAGERFASAVALGGESDGFVAWLAVLSGWLEGGYDATSRHREYLERQDWSSPAEFFGHLTRMLFSRERNALGLDTWETMREKALVSYVSGLKARQAGDLPAAEDLFRQGQLSSPSDAWESLLLDNVLAEVERERERGFRDPVARAAYLTERDGWRAGLADYKIAEEYRLTQAVEATAAFRDSESYEDRRAALLRLLELDPNSRTIENLLTVFAAMNDDWATSLEHGRRYLGHGHRESAGRLGTGILVAQVLTAAGQQREAEQLLRTAAAVRDPWYRELAKFLLGAVPEATLVSLAKDAPERQIALHTLLGFKAEQAGDVPAARKAYVIALETFLTDRQEYDFAGERLRRLRKE